MKKVLKHLVTFINTLLVRSLKKNVSLKKSTLCFVKVQIGKTNHISFYNSKIETSQLFIQGKSNLMKSENALLSDCQINITGTSNKLIIETNVKLRNAVIHIRGNNSNIRIGKGTSTGGVRIVNAGNDNSVDIGENCMLADYIEIWASDTHSIFNENGEKINFEKPIKIGNNVWIGSHVIILKGVTIEDWGIIGMGSLVVNDIPANTVSAGSPNRIIKKGVTWKLEN